MEFTATCKKTLLGCTGILSNKHLDYKQELITSLGKSFKDGFDFNIIPDGTLDINITSNSIWIIKSNK